MATLKLVEVDDLKLGEPYWIAEEGTETEKRCRLLQEIGDRSPDHYYYPTYKERLSIALNVAIFWLTNPRFLVNQIFLNRKLNKQYNLERAQWREDAINACKEMRKARGQFYEY